MKPVFVFIPVFVLFAVMTADRVSAAPMDSSPALWELSPASFSASADVDLYLAPRYRAQEYRAQGYRRRSVGGRIWSNIYYGDTTLKPKNQGKIAPHFYGLQLGLDLAKGGPVYASYFFNLNQSETKFPGATSTIDNFLFGLGRFYYYELFYLAFTGSIGYDRYEISGWGEKAKGDGLQKNLFGEFGLSFKLGQWAVKPFYTLQYDYLYHGRIGKSPVILKDWDGHSLTQLFGTRLNWAPFPRWEFQSRAVWVHEMLDNPPPFYRMHFSPGHGISTPAIMFYHGNTGRDWAWLGLGGKFTCGLNIHLFFDYDALLNKRHTTHLGSIGLLLGW